MREVFADFDIVNFPCGNTGCQMGGWFRREVNTLAELRGIKMRIPGLGAEVLSRLGVTVQTIPGGEIYPALERGVVDAAEWIGPYDDLKLGFHRVAKNYYYPGWWEPGPTLSLYVNRTAWDSLPSEYQAVVAAAAAETNIDMTARYDAQNPAAVRTLEDEGVTLRPFSNEIMTGCRDTAFELMNENAAARRRLPEDLRVLGRGPAVLLPLVQHRRTGVRPFSRSEAPDRQTAGPPATAAVSVSAVAFAGRPAARRPTGAP